MCRELRKSYRRVLLPVPIIAREKGYVADRELGTVHITYIGRGTRMWKVKPLKKLVGDLGAMADQAFHVHVFTDTHELFKSELHAVNAANVDVEYHVGYTMESLSRRLLELSDLHYSMGTACLEGAVLGIPTLIADASYSDFPSRYRYRWLVDDLENYAGVFLESATPTGRPLGEIIAAIRNPVERQRLSDATHDAVLANFSSKQIAQKIVALQPRARVRDVLRYMPSYWLQSGPLRRGA